MSLWGEFETSSTTSYLPLKIPTIAKGRGKPRSETIISGAVHKCKVDPIGCPSVRARLNLPIEVPAGDQNPVETDGLQLDYKNVDPTLTYAIVALCKFQGFDSVDKEVLDNLVDLSKHFLANFGEKVNANMERCARGKVNGAQIVAKERESILDASIKQCGLDDDGLNGLANWYRSYVVHTYGMDELIGEESHQDNHAGSRRASLKGRSRKFDKPHSVSLITPCFNTV